jgi:hypothetical protein
MVLGFKTQVSHRAETLNPFLLWLFWRQGLAVYPGELDHDPYIFRLYINAGMTGICHQAQLFSIVMRVS